MSKVCKPPIPQFDHDAAKDAGESVQFHDAGYVIDADYNGIWAWAYRPERAAYEGGSRGEGRLWCGSHPLPAALIDEFNAWQNRFEYAQLDEIPRGADGVEGFSWRRFHADGLRLAKRLKQLLGREYVVIYARPFEDRTGRGPRTMIVTDSGRLAPYVHVPWPVVASTPCALQ